MKNNVGNELRINERQPECTTVKVYFEGQLECGAYIKSASVILPDDYTMNQLVTAIKNKGFINFMTDSMCILVNIK